MSENLRHLISAAELENDLDALGRLLCLYELDDDVRAVLYEAIDRVAGRLHILITTDSQI